MAGGSTISGRIPRAPALLAAATLAAFALLAAHPAIDTAAADCRYADAKAHTVSLDKLRRSITCLVNHFRKSHDREPVDPNSKLRSAAQKHTKVMLNQDCLRHNCPGEPRLKRRVRRSGYLDGAKKWYYAESLGYENTPRQMFQRFRNHRYDRNNMLNGKVRDIGVGVGWGAATHDSAVVDARFATYTLLFGWRRG